MKKTFKIAFSGKICSGKTTSSVYLINRCKNEMIKLSFADKIKELAHDLFDMKNKNRKLLQNIGTAMRKINPDVFANYLIKQSKKHNLVCVDDARFLNEINSLRKNGFYIVKLNISKDLQLRRLKLEYPNTFEKHVSRFGHQSEQEIDLIHPSMFDQIINVDVDNLFNELEKIIEKFKLG